MNTPYDYVKKYMNQYDLVGFDEFLGQAGVVVTRREFSSWREKAVLNSGIGSMIFLAEGLDSPSATKLYCILKGASEKGKKVTVVARGDFFDKIGESKLDWAIDKTYTLTPICGEVYYIVAESL
jgi:hypothetical protein